MGRASRLRRRKGGEVKVQELHGILLKSSGDVLENPLPYGHVKAQYVQRGLVQTEKDRI